MRWTALGGVAIVVLSLACAGSGSPRPPRVKSPKGTTEAKAPEVPESAKDDDPNPAYVKAQADLDAANERAKQAALAEQKAHAAWDAPRPAAPQFRPFLGVRLVGADKGEFITLRQPGKAPPLHLRKDTLVDLLAPDGRVKVMSGLHKGRGGTIDVASLEPVVAKVVLAHNEKADEHSRREAKLRADYEAARKASREAQEAANKARLALNGLPATVGAVRAIAQAREKARRAKEEEAERAEAKRRDAEAKRRAEEESDFDGLVLLNKTLQGTITDFGGHITGTVLNRRGKTLRYAQITVTLYDESGAQVGTALANINDLEEDGRWNFKAVAFRKYARYRVSKVSGF